MDKLKYIKYRLKWFLSQYIDFKHPIHVDIELNNTCNQKCLSCWHNGQPPFSLDSMELRKATYYLYSARKAGCVSVKFNLRGEPLLYKYLPQVISRAKLLGFIDIMINTNGILLDQAMCKSLSESGLTTCIISVDSLYPQTYQKLHNVPLEHYSKLMRNLCHLARKRNYFKVVLNFHKNKINKKELESNNNKNLKKWAKVVIRDTQERLGENISEKQLKLQRKRKCPHMQRRLTITTNDKVYPCCVCYNEPEDIRLNKYEHQLLLDIFNGKKRKQLQSNYKKGVYTESCQNCTSGDIWKT